MFCYNLWGGQNTKSCRGQSVSLFHPKVWNGRTKLCHWRYQMSRAAKRKMFLHELTQHYLNGPSGSPHEASQIHCTMKETDRVIEGAILCRVLLTESPGVAGRPRLSHSVGQSVVLEPFVHSTTLLTHAAGLCCMSFCFLPAFIYLHNKNIPNKAWGEWNLPCHPILGQLCGYFLSLSLWIHSCKNNVIAIESFCTHCDVPVPVLS